MPGRESYLKLNEQAVKLIKAAMQNTGGNILFSPLNLMTALAMAAVGARGETLRELSEVLGFPETGTDRFVREALDALARENGRTLLTHFAAWFAADVELTDEYARSLENCFDSKVERADFSQREAVAAKINSTTPLYPNASSPIA